MYMRLGLYLSLSACERANLVANLAGDLKQVRNDGVKYTMLSYFQKADAEYGRKVTAALGADQGRVDALTAKLAD